MDGGVAIRAAAVEGSGPIRATISLSVNCIAVYDAIVTTDGAAIVSISRSGDTLAPESTVVSREPDMGRVPKGRPLEGA